MTSPRTTAKPCPCGSGLTGKRDLSVAGYMRVYCARCKEPIQHTGATYRKANNATAKRQAAARRRLEEMREARELEGML